MKKIIASLILLFFVASQVGSDMEAVLSNGAGARAIGMGKAQVADPKGSESVYWNPAKLAKGEKLELSSSVADIYGVTYRTFAFMMPGLGGQLGFMLLSAYQGGIPEATLDANGRPSATGSMFAYDASAWLFSYGRSLGKMLLGTTLKYLKENLADKGSSGFGVDLGVALEPSDNFSLGAKIENLFKPQMKWDTASNSVNQSSTKVRVGASVKGKGGQFKINADMDIKEDKTTEFYFGGEYRLAEALALRGGVFNGLPTFGLGLNYRGFNLDYSYAKGNDYLEDSHRVSLGIGLDEPALLFAKKNTELPTVSKSAETRRDVLTATIPSAEMKQKVPLEKKQIAFFDSGLAYPGKTYYFKVATPGIKAERVSVIFANEKIQLYQENGYWKGDFTVSSRAKTGRQYLDIYVADVDGHLYKQRATFEINSLPEIKWSKLDLKSDTCAFEISLPENIERASLMVGERKIPLVLSSQGKAIVALPVNEGREEKILYLADKDGHLFSYKIKELSDKFEVCQKLIKEEFSKEGKISFSLGWLIFGIFAFVGIFSGVTFFFLINNGKTDQRKDLEIGDSEIIF